MPHPTGRGGPSFDAHRLRTATTDAHENSITVTTDGRPAPVTYRFPDDVLGRQLRTAIWAMLPHAQLGGTWASGGTLRTNVYLSRKVHREWSKTGLDFSSRHLEADDLRRLKQRLGGSFRHLRRAFVWALTEYHPDGTRLAEQLSTWWSSSGVRDATRAYETEAVQTMEAAARERFLHWYMAHRQLLADVGVDVDKRDWILLPAEVVIATARTTGTAASERLVRLVTGETCLSDADPRLFPSTGDLAATAVLMCLAESLGLNWSALQSITCHSVVPTGDGAAMVDVVKARGVGKLRIPTSTADLTTLGGLATALIGLTRFARWQRKRDAADDPVALRNGDLLFVVAGRTGVLRDVAASSFGEEVVATVGERLSMRRLRQTAEFRGKRSTGEGTAAGHGRATSLRYLAEGIPEAELARLVIEAQDDIVELARAALHDRPAADTRLGRELADGRRGGSVDRGVATCVTAGLDPGTDALCNRGILGCFTCPAGHRTEANIPGLKATVELTAHIGAVDRDEWDNGPAEILHHFAQAALEQFDQHDVDAADHLPMLPVVAAIYHEVRA